jgi:predicted O-methyltransferase YrrM
MKQFVETLFRRHRERLLDDYPRLLDLWKERIQRRSTSLQDCLFLYLLVKEFRPKVIFEVGTFVGTTAVFMAEASELQATLYTCDMREAYVQQPRYEGVIVPMLGTHSARASKELRRKGVEIDLVFADGRVDWRTGRHIAAMLAEDGVFATHDFVAGDKGEANLKRMKRRLSGRSLRELSPEPHL